MLVMDWMDDKWVVGVGFVFIHIELPYQPEIYRIGKWEYDGMMIRSLFGMIWWVEIE